MVEARPLITRKVRVRCLEKTGTPTTSSSTLRVSISSGRATPMPRATTILDLSCSSSPVWRAATALTHPGFTPLVSPMEVVCLVTSLLVTPLHRQSLLASLRCLVLTTRELRMSAAMDGLSPLQLATQAVHQYHSSVHTATPMAPSVTLAVLVGADVCPRSRIS